MSKNTSISLGNHFQDFINEKIKSGRFHSASEVIRAGLRLLEDQETKIQNLREALIEGEKSKTIKDFDPEKLKRELNKRVKV
jgi:antitoxin ParD1/3/4